MRWSRPAVRLLVGASGLVAAGSLLKRDRVGRCEVDAFRALNDLPDALYRPTWTVMQLGTLGAAPAVAAVACLSGRRRLAARVLIGGSATWALSKVVKRLVRRPRPAALLLGTHVRGRAPTGLGYVSGHAGVAVAIGIAVVPHLGRRGRVATRALVPVVGASRVYVGAHLPLDIVGGASLGLLVDAAVELLMRH